MTYLPLDNSPTTTVTLKGGVDILNITHQELYSVNSGGTPLVGVQNRVWATGSGSNTQASFRALTTADLPTDLTDGGDSVLHYHASDRDRSNHTGTQSADTITNGSTNKVFTAAEQTKLANIQPDADVDTSIELTKYISGLSILTQNLPLLSTTQASVLADGTLLLLPIYLPTAVNITGVLLCKGIQASYTGDNENSVSLFTESGGTLTRVALGTGLEAVLENATTGIVQVPFSAPYSATAGIYWVGVLPNWSSVATQPTLHTRPYQTLTTSNRSLMRTQTTTTSAPASLALSGLTSSAFPIWVGLY